MGTVLCLSISALTLLVFNLFYSRDIGCVVVVSTQIIMPENFLRQIEIRLSEAVTLYQRRLDWLTSDSRRLCGVITETSVCLVLDFQPPPDDDQFQLQFFTDMVVCLLNEQVSRLGRFNIFWYDVWPVHIQTVDFLDPVAQNLIDRSSPKFQDW